MADLLLVVQSCGPDVTVVHADGEIDLETKEQLRSCLSSVLAPKVLLDLTRVTFLDSSGMAVIVAANKDAEARGGGLRLRNPNGMITDTLTMVGLGSLLRT
jgi:anti-anti-sigma factor